VRTKTESNLFAAVTSVRELNLQVATQARLGTKYSSESSKARPHASRPLHSCCSRKNSHMRARDADPVRLKCSMQLAGSPMMSMPLWLHHVIKPGLSAMPLFCITFITSCCTTHSTTQMNMRIAPARYEKRAALAAVRDEAKSGSFIPDISGTRY